MKHLDVGQATLGMRCLRSALSLVVALTLCLPSLPAWAAKSEAASSSSVATQETGKQSKVEGEDAKGGSSSSEPSELNQKGSGKDGASGSASAKKNGADPVGAKEDASAEDRKSVADANEVKEDAKDSDGKKSGSESSTASNGEAGNQKDQDGRSGDPDAASAKDSDKNAATTDDQGAQSDDGKGEASRSGAEASSSSSGKKEAPEKSSDPRDIAKDWKAGNARVEAEGSYILSSDVKSKKPLIVALPKGASATVDLAGHSATVVNDSDGDADSASSSLACAIDLSSNAGAITFVDSTYEEGNGKRPKSTIELTAVGLEKDAAVVNAVRSAGTKGAHPKATFKDVRLVGSAEATSSKSRSHSLSVVRTGLAVGVDSAWKADEESVNVAFDGCSLAAKSVIADDPKIRTDIEGAGEAPGKTSIVDARCRGIEFAGKTTLVCKDDETNLAQALAPLMLSAFDKTFSISSNFKVVTEEGKEIPQAKDDAAERSLIVFGYPSELAEKASEMREGASEAVVLQARKGEVISPETASLLCAELGYDARWEQPEDGKEGFSRLAIAPTPAEQPQEAESTSADEGAAIDTFVDELPEAAQDESSKTESGLPLRLLATPHVYAEHLATPSETALATEFTTEASSTDLNAAWKAQEGGLSSRYTITKGGTYYLSGNLSAQSSLAIDAKGKAVKLVFNGHTLSLAGTGALTSQTLIDVVAAKSVSFTGTAGSMLVSSNSGTMRAINSDASGCKISISGLTISLSSSSTSLRYLQAHCVRLTSGSLTMNNTAVDLDLGNQILGNSNIITCMEAPSALYATSGVSKVALSNCTVKATGTPALAVEDKADINSVGNAYALYSLASTTDVKGGSFTAESQCGNATCIYATSATISSHGNSQVSLEANAGQLATGILSTKAGGVALCAPMSFTVASKYRGIAEAEAVLRSSVVKAPGGFVFGDCAPGAGSYSVLTMANSTLSGANAKGNAIGTFSSTLSSTARSKVVSALANALGSEASCVPSASGSTVQFVLDNAKAAARIGSTYYSTIDEALNAFSPGQTLTLLKNADAISVSKVGDGVIDLNGATVKSLEFSYGSSARGLTVKNGAIDGGQMANGAHVAVYHHSSAPLTLSGVSVNARASDTRTCGVYAAASTGTLTINGSSDVQAMVTLASSVGKEAYGVLIEAGGPELVIDGSAIVSRSASATAAVRGISSANKATIRNSSIAAQGAAGPTTATIVGGTLQASNVIFSAHTSNVADEASCVRLSDYPEATSVLFSDCTFKLTAAVSQKDLEQSCYACVLGSTSESGAVLPKDELTFSGKTTFSSAGGLHIGRNVNRLSLGAGFSLGESSDDIVRLSQAEQPDDIGVTTAEGFKASDELAGRFGAAVGSHYEGWKLVANAQGDQLIWYPENYIDGKGIVSVTHNGVVTPYASLAKALKEAAAGDTLTLLADLTEPGAQTVEKENITFDLAGHTATLKAGAQAAESGAGGGALRYTASGTLTVKDSAGGGMLALRIGAASETSSGMVYQGITVSGGGTLSIAENTTVRVSYAGSTDSLAVQQSSIAVQGIAVPNGKLLHAGTVTVESAASDGALGAMTAYGVYAEPSVGRAAAVETTPQAVVQVKGLTDALTTKSVYYSEAVTQACPSGVREIFIDPKNDSAFYRDVLDAFRATATYDDPNDSGLREAFGTYVYFAQPLKLSRPGAWYDGLYLWAFSDEVKGNAVGKMKSIVPTHFFVNSSYDELPTAYGIATGAKTAGKATVSVKGSVTVECSHGNAYAVNAECSTAGSASLSCDGASLSARADDAVHPVAQDDFDLRDFITFSASKQDKRVAYSSLATTKRVVFQAPRARNVVAGTGVSLALAGSERFSLNALDAAAVEATSFAVDKTFSLANGSEKCSVINREGANVLGATFAKGATDPGLFTDASGAYQAGKVNNGVAWSHQAAYTVTFMVGDAIVARYAAPSSIHLKEPSKHARRLDDQRQSYNLVGWSLKPDETAQTGYEAKDSTVSPRSSAVYHAVYGVGSTSVPLSFTNILDASGTGQPAVSLVADYGRTVGETLEARGASLPNPSDYVDPVSGITYRFVGWHPYTASSSTQRIYNNRQVRNLEISLAAAGVNVNGALELRAVYVALLPGQHIVTFIVDDTTSVCVVDDGAVPSYALVNTADNSYVVPQKSDGETGKAYTFDSWYVDADSNGAFGAGEASYSAVLPRATSDAEYTAKWSWNWSDVSLTFRYKHYDEESGEFQQSGVKTIATNYKASVQKVANSVAAIGSKVGYGGKVYQLDGWSVRASDVEPLYDASHPIPKLSTDNATFTNTYSKTYYGIYTTSNHMVKVTFVDGSKTLGSVRISSLKTVDNAFAKTKAVKPDNKSKTKQFKGWAKKRSAKEALDGATTTLDDVVGPTAEKVTLYAVYGDPSVYTVRLRAADKLHMLGRVSVKSGESVNSVLKAKKKTLEIPVQEGSYFYGWQTAAGKDFSLDDPVTGSLDLYATYNKITVKTSTSNIGATVSSVSPDLEGAQSVRFTVTQRESADRPITRDLVTNSYTPIDHYDIRLIATDAKGKKKLIVGDFGTANITAKVGKKYRKSVVRAFWLGTEKEQETVMHSAAKKADSKGLVSVSIGNYTVGDADEGGNFSFGFTTGQLAGDGGAQLQSGQDGVLLGATLGGLAPRSLSGALSQGLTRNGLASNLPSNGAKGIGAGSRARAGAGSGDGGEGGGDAEADLAESSFDGWGSEAVVLILLALVAFGALLYGFWRLVVVRQRRNEAEVELPDIADRYSGGVRF